MKFILAFIHLLLLCIVFSRRVKRHSKRQELAKPGEGCGNPTLPPHHQNMRPCVKGYTCKRNPAADPKIKGVGNVCVKEEDSIASQFSGRLRNLIA